MHSRAAHIVETATNIIKRDGISALTHRAVASEAHIPLGSTTYHFNSLDDMLNAVMRSAIALFRDDMFSWFRQRRHDDPRDVLTDFVMRGIEDIDDLAREYELFTAAISRPSLRPIALEWSNTVVAIIKVVAPDSAALPLGTLLNGFSSVHCWKNTSARCRAIWFISQFLRCITPFAKPDGFLAGKPFSPQLLPTFFSLYLPFTIKLYICTIFCQITKRK
nr:TetR family transcriptional regulator [Pectobacterium sp. PL152]